MIFTQAVYLIFFAVVFTTHWLLPQRHRVRFLFLASCVFYASWNALYLLLIFGSTLIDYGSALQMDKRDDARWRRRWLVVSLCGNLGSLAVFKYFNFFSASFAALLEAIGFHVSPATLNVLLPVGISFYTFQSMSYTIDVYRGQLRPTRDLTLFACYVAFFPQLVAGPIVRARDLLPQLAKEPSLTARNLEIGLRFFLIGLIKKGVFADVIALRLVDPVFADPSAFSGVTLWTAVVGYAVQIFCDFSGYSDMAIGSAMALGYRLPRNFDMPYISRSCAEFWRRWHISLSSWLRDYLYISLGGSRGGRWLTLRNLMLTMFLGGLWHGAGWTFVAWGVAHGLLLVVHRSFSELCERSAKLTNVVSSRAWQPVAWALTFVSVLVTWALFRSTSFALAWDYLVGMFTWRVGASLLPPEACLLIVAFAGGRLFSLWRDPIETLDNHAPILRGAVYAVVIFAAVVLIPVSGQPFIYFQF